MTEEEEWGQKVRLTTKERLGHGGNVEDKSRAFKQHRQFLETRGSVSCELFPKFVRAGFRVCVRSKDEGREG